MNNVSSLISGEYAEGHRYSLEWLRFWCWLFFMIQETVVDVTT